MSDSPGGSATASRGLVQEVVSIAFSWDIGRSGFRYCVPQPPRTKRFAFVTEHLLHFVCSSTLRNHRNLVYKETKEITQRLVAEV